MRLTERLPFRQARFIQEDCLPYFTSVSVLPDLSMATPPPAIVQCIFHDRLSGPLTRADRGDRFVCTDPMSEVL